MKQTRQLGTPPEQLLFCSCGAAETGTARGGMSTNVMLQAADPAAMSPVACLIVDVSVLDGHRRVLPRRPQQQRQSRGRTRSDEAPQACRIRRPPCCSVSRRFLAAPGGRHAARWNPASLPIACVCCGVGA